MITRNALRVIALASSCLAPLVAHAADSTTPSAPAPADAPMAVGGLPISGEFGFGIMGVMGTNPDQAGRYSGFNTNGVDILGHLDLQGRNAWNSGDTRYFDFNIDNFTIQTGTTLGSGLGNDSHWSDSITNAFSNNGSLGLRFGNQGTWEAGFFANSITYTGNVVDSLYTTSRNQATLNPGVSAYGGALPGTKGSITSYMVPSLLATGAILPTQVGTRRDSIGGNFKYLWNNWNFTGAFNYEHKEGSLEESFDGPWGGTAFAMPVDYDTERYDLSAAYTDRINQAIVQYTFSHFTDNNRFIILPYPTSNTAAPFQRAAAYSTPPSNTAQYITVELGSNFIPETRVNLNARVGVEQQNDAFAPNTADPSGANLTGASLTGLNPMLQGTSGNSPDITATVYQVRLSANTHPIPRTDFDLFYGIDGRSVSLNQYKVITGGTGGSGADTTPGGATNFNFVVPQDWLKQDAGANATYRLIPESNTRLTVGYKLDVTDRSNAQVGHSYTNAASVGLLSNIGPDLDGKLSFDYADRSGNLSYLTPWENLIGPTSAQTFSGAYYQAPMTSEAVTLRADYTPSNKVLGGFYVQFKNENYSYPGIPLIAGATPATIPFGGAGGLKQDYALTLGPDITYRPTPNINIHVFYDYERLFYNFQGNGACSTAADIAGVAGTTSACTGSVGDNVNKYSSGTHTVGISGEWKATAKLTLKGDYTLSYGSVGFTEFNGVFVPFTPTQSYQNVSNYPDIDSLMNSVRLTATYEVSPKMELVGQVAWYTFHNTDWNDTGGPVQGAGSTTISYLTPGYSAPNYNIAMVMGGMRIRF
ncbi:MAG TPA: MtrB/PioB family outer membrane beta-barrel protein [Acetobacteraceae bacterium]|jgi:hypothetical protein